MALLEIENLSVEFPSATGMVRAVDGVSLVLSEGELLVVVGESGSGKSLTMLAVMGLVPYPGRVTADRLRFKDLDLLTLSARERRALTGKSVAMIFQEPATSLNPCFTVGFQLVEGLRIHEKMGRRAARSRAIELLEQVGIPAAEDRLRAYPHQLSGGMKQRVMIAMALSMRPRLLIADEPTTALDVTIQAQILDLMRRLREELGTAILLITHDLGVVNELADRVSVMYAGRMVEEGARPEILAAPRHPYTQGLLRSMPARARRGERLVEIPGVVPTAGEWPSGCRFRTRCALAFARCADAEPSPVALPSGHTAWCHAVAREESAP
jgi:dipeptide transport system ATP-binding protein